MIATLVALIFAGLWVCRESEVRGLERLQEAFVEKIRRLTDEALVAEQRKLEAVKARDEYALLLMEAKIERDRFAQRCLSLEERIKELETPPALILEPSHAAL